MNNENVICKTECKHKRLVTIPAVIWWIISIIVLIPSEEYALFGTVSAITKYKDGSIHIHEEYVFLILVLLCVPIIIYMLNRYFANRCNLTVTENQIYGNVNIMFSSKKLQMPLDKLDNIMTSNGIIDKCRGGETIIVSSNSGKIKFPYVYNATEFVNATLAAKEKYNANKTPQQNVASEPVVPQSNADELKKYKDLLDNGVITQDEFDAKKKQLLGL